MKAIDSFRQKGLIVSKPQDSDLNRLVNFRALDEKTARLIQWLVRSELGLVVLAHPLSGALEILKAECRIANRKKVVALSYFDISELIESSTAQIPVYFLGGFRDVRDFHEFLERQSEANLAKMNGHIDFVASFDEASNFVSMDEIKVDASRKAVYRTTLLESKRVITSTGSMPAKFDEAQLNNFASIVFEKPPISALSHGDGAVSFFPSPLSELLKNSAVIKLALCADALMITERDREARSAEISQNEIESLMAMVCQFFGVSGDLIDDYVGEIDDWKVVIKSGQQNPKIEFLR